MFAECLAMFLVWVKVSDFSSPICVNERLDSAALVPRNDGLLGRLSTMQNSGESLWQLVQNQVTLTLLGIHDLRRAVTHTRH